MIPLMLIVAKLWSAFSWFAVIGVPVLFFCFYIASGGGVHLDEEPV